MSICNFYTPNNPIDQQKFAQIVKELLMSKALISNLIIGGDWNVTLHATEKKGGIQWKPTAYRNQIIAMMNDLVIVDVFKEKNQNKYSYTYESTAKKIKSRIDFSLVAKTFIQKISKTEIKTLTAPSVLLYFNVANNKCGPGLWKIDNLLLNEESYITSLGTATIVI